MVFSNFECGLNFGLALLIAIIVHFEGIRKNGIKKYLKEYLSPTPVMLFCR